MRRLIHLAHPTSAKQLSELIAPQLARLGDLLTEFGHDMRNDYCSADEQVIRLVHHQRQPA